MWKRLLNDRTGRTSVPRPVPSPETLIQVSLLGEAIDHGPVGILVADEKGRYIAVNQFAADMLGYTRQELLNLAITDVAPFPETASGFQSVMSGGITTGTYPYVRKDGEVVEIGFRAGATTVAGMRLYIAVWWPLDDSGNGSRSRQ